jgi:hypothetical protein
MLSVTESFNTATSERIGGDGCLQPGSIPTDIIERSITVEGLGN